MGDDREQQRPVAGALRRALRTVAWLAPLVFAVVTAAALMIAHLGGDDISYNPPPDPGPTADSSAPPPPAPTEAPPTDAETDAEEAHRALRDSEGILDHLGSAAAIGAVAALITALGTAAARVMVAMGQLRLANANAEAIRAGRPPALGPEDGPEAEPGSPA
ncbi:hypothetical protein [Streptomyces millisiae]|uniref:Uncharacterized protein n=1 Tax=Streptomyces millisiae TaxID=3075542 RepID=A0ABU2LY27_9ACTN|nr:hypothetical protein [Streptomyces sp. DSM 44918]MDT0322509.1 hypothetical protein [Streptomyces sp. DSM 44918]